MDFSFFAFQFSCAYISFIFLLSCGWKIKSISSFKKNQEAQGLLLQITNSPVFAVFQLLIAIEFLFKLNKLFYVLSLSSAIIIVITGIVYKYIKKDEQCYCFGQHIISSKLKLNILNALMIISLATCTNIFFSYSNKDTLMKNDYGFIFFALISCLLLFNMRKDFFKIEKSPYLQKNTKIGKKDGIPITIDSLPFNKPIFILQISKTCPYCENLLTDILKLESVFFDSFLLCVIADKEIKCSEEVANRIIILYDNEFTFFQELECNTYPSAVIIFGESRKQMASVAMGPHKIRILFALLLNASTK